MWGETNSISDAFSITHYEHVGTFEDDNGKAIIRVHQSLFNYENKRNDPASKKRRDKFNNSLVRIEHGEQSVYAILKYISAKKFNKDSVAIPVFMTKKLGITDRKQKVHLTIALAKNKDIDKFFAMHPDPTLRMTEWLSRRRQWSAALLGFVLGIVASYSVRFLDIGFGLIPKLMEYLSAL